MKKLFPLLILGIAFGIVEGSVVIYMRPLFSPANDFSLILLQPEILNEVQMIALKTEIGREIATLFLLGAAAAIAARSFLYWASYFVFTFAVWDITYYVWLAMRIGWPGSLMDWDILFLVPVMWLAPVIVPCIISLIGILVSMLVIRTLDVCGTVRPRPQHWMPVVLALVLWQVSFVNNTAAGMNQFPESYSWWLFITGIVLVLVATVLFYFDIYRKHRGMMFRT